MNRKVTTIIINLLSPSTIFSQENNCYIVWSLLQETFAKKIYKIKILQLETL